MKLSKHRLEFFSDGMMAIIMTIMVLEIPIPKPFSFEVIGELLEPLLIFFVSFFIVSGFLYKHHQMVDHLKVITPKIVWKNFMFLFFVALLPVFTKLVIENSGNNIAILLYNINFVMANIFFFMLGHEARKQFSEEQVDKIISARREIARNKYALLRMILGVILLLAMVVLLLLFPKISIVVFLAFPILVNLLNIFKENEHKINFNRGVPRISHISQSVKHPQGE